MNTFPRTASSLQIPERNYLPFFPGTTVRSESRCALRLRYIDLVVSVEVAFECAAASLYSFVKQRLKYNTGKVCNCLI
jgi:hypothetical protein